jgi:1,4-alpha-glucan branching enzyme
MRTSITCFYLLLFAGTMCKAQTAPAVPAPPLPSGTKPASTNIVGAQYPRVDSLRQVYFRLRAPEAQTVSVSLKVKTDFGQVQPNHSIPDFIITP